MKKASYSIIVILLMLGGYWAYDQQVEEAITLSEAVAEPETALPKTTPQQADDLEKIRAKYYPGTEGLTGQALKSRLHELINNHVKFTYREVYDILIELDRDPDNPDKVLCLYSGFSMDARAKFANGMGWNREHVWAKSYGNFGTSPGAGTDLHHIRATDVSTNEARNNRSFDFAEVLYVDSIGHYQGKTSSKFSERRWVWEPPNEVKGDIARMLFYMAVRYEGGPGDPDLELTDKILARNSKEPLHGRLSTLLRWHRQDPPSEAERKRNELIYSKYQQNRNPFIDIPEFADKIWGRKS
jgi:endonuclease I